MVTSLLSPLYKARRLFRSAVLFTDRCFINDGRKRCSQIAIPPGPVRWVPWFPEMNAGLWTRRGARR